MKNTSKAVTSIQATALCVVAKAPSKPVREASARPAAKALSGETVGINVGDRVSQFCRLDAAGENSEQGRPHATAASMEKHFAKLPAAVIALETGAAGAG